MVAKKKKKNLWCFVQKGFNQKKEVKNKQENKKKEKGSYLLGNE